MQGVLLVHHSHELPAAVAHALAAAGVSVVRAQSRDELQARADEQDYAVGLFCADDGERALADVRLLRRSRRARSMHVLFVCPEGSWLREAYTLGNVDHVSAPPLAEVLQAKLGQVLERHREARAFQHLQLEHQSELKRAEQLREGNEQRLTALAEVARRSEDRLRLALEAGRLGIWELDLDEGILTSSDTCKANYGRAAHERFNYADLAASVLPDDRPRWEASIADAIRRVAELEVEYRTQWPDGSIHWVLVRAHCGTDAQGRVVSMAGVSLHIDDRKRAEERLQLLDALGEATRTAADAASVMEATTRLVNESLRADRCAYADLEPDNDRFTIRHDHTVLGLASTVGVYSLDMFGPRAANELRAGRTLTVRDVDAELAPAEGADTFNAIGIKAIICCPLVKAGRLLAMMAVHQTAPRNWRSDEVALLEVAVERAWAHIERVRAAERLREQDRRKDEFLATLAHELRNPLAPLRTGLEVLKVAPSPQATTRAREIMERQLGHMVRLIDDLLDVSRINLGRVELKRETLRLQSVVEHALEASKPYIDRGRHTLDVNQPAEPIWLEGDLTRLSQVLSNLLNNAAKYTPDGGRIALTVTPEPGFVQLTVTDNGAGIASESLSRVFDLFTQVRGTLHRAQGGLGIGLSLVRQLVALHGGTVQAASDGTGKGSAFTVRLPTLANHLLAATGPESEPGARTRFRRVLVVDDNVDAAEMLATMLQLDGHETRVAHEGCEALMQARSFLPELIFLDIGLPGLSGYEVAELLRADPQLAHITLIALTGWGGEEDKQRSKQAGFAMHLTKPVDAIAVRNLLARFRSQPPPPL